MPAVPCSGGTAQQCAPARADGESGNLPAAEQSSAEYVQKAAESRLKCRLCEKHVKTLLY
jgi:hypothetical protein